MRQQSQKNVFWAASVLSFYLAVVFLPHSLGLAWDIEKNVMYVAVPLRPCSCG